MPANPEAQADRGLHPDLQHVFFQALIVSCAIENC